MNQTKEKFKKIPANKRSISQRKLIYGIGINDADYLVTLKINGKQIMCPFYRTWKSILTRCYSKKYHKKRPTYRYCTIENEWNLFSNFKIWMENQEWQEKQLDKDILYPGNKHYSPKNCIFISAQINLLLTDSKSIRGKYPQGVSFLKVKNRFVAYCNVNKNKKHLGCFANQEEASAEYKKFKSKLIKKIANEQTDQRLKSGLLLHAKIIEEVE